MHTQTDSVAQVTYRNKVPKVTMRRLTAPISRDQLDYLIGKVKQDLEWLKSKEALSALPFRRRQMEEWELELRQLRKECFAIQPLQK
jgi:hypothetical protein